MHPNRSRLRTGALLALTCGLSLLPLALVGCDDDGGGGGDAAAGGTGGGIDGGTGGAKSDGAAGNGGTTGDAGMNKDGEVVLFNCQGKPDGTNCSEADAGGSICLQGSCVVSRCGDGYVDPVAGEECESGDGCNQCRFRCKANPDCDDGLLCNGAETCNVTAHVCVAGTAAADNTACTVETKAGTCMGGTCVQAGCGNGVVDNGEECDTAINDQKAGCTAQCKWICKTNPDCSDGNACNGVETCAANHSCQPGTALDCNDNKTCTMDSCDTATGCVHKEIDADGDGVSLCSNDCKDNDKDVYPGRAECADNKDNNCNNVVDEGVAPLACYADPDKDGFAGSGTAAMNVAACGCPAGYTNVAPTVAKQTDCAPLTASAYPGQTAWFSSAYCTTFLCLGPAASYSYDYNCSGNAEQRYTLKAQKTCSMLSFPGGVKICLGSGWVADVPACGAPAANFIECSVNAAGTGCTANVVSKKQECH